MYALRLKSVTKPGAWAYISLWTGTRLYRSAYSKLELATLEEATSLIQEIKDAWESGRITSSRLTSERINSIEIYKLPY